MKRRSVFVAGAAAAGAVAALRRRRRAARVDVYYADGSMDTLDPSTARARRMLSLAAEALAATSL